MEWAITITDDVSPRLHAAIDSMVDNLSRKLDEAGGEMEAFAKRIAPVRTGYLRNSIGHRINPGMLELIFFANANYAVFVEFGTCRMAAKPFMRPAWDYYRWTLLEKEGQAVLESLSMSA